jgi:outer membrane protein assembly factor BamB/predicted phosphodiesterase
MRAGAIVLTVLALAATAEARTIRGLVYDDANGDGRPSAGEAGVKAVVAFGVEKFAWTDDKGQFVLEVPERAGMVWVRVPEGFVPGPVWTVADARPQLDLGLRRLAAPHRGPLTFVVAADTHLAPDQPFKDDLAAVVGAATALAPAPAFLTLLGDITQKNGEADFALVDRGLAKLGVPYIPVPGNHDWYDGGEAWFRHYGPDNYSFDIGGVHFVVWNMAMTGDEIAAYLGAELSRVGTEMTVVALTHAPPAPEVLGVLRTLGVDYVLTGHTHTNRVVDHGGLIELTTEPLLMGGLDFMPAGYRVVTIDRGRLAAYHRTVVDRPQLAIVAPAPGGCVPRTGGTVTVAAELDARIPDVTARLDCGTPIALKHVGGWNWRAELPALIAGPHSLAVTAGTTTRHTSFVAGCENPAASGEIAPWAQAGGNAAHTGFVTRPIAPPLVQRWATAIGGHVLQAAPVIGDGAAFVVATDLGRGDTGGVVALELTTGAVRWRHTTGVPVRGGLAIAGATVAAVELDGTLLGLDTRTGLVRWRSELGDPGMPPEAAAVYASITADGDDVIAGHQRRLAVVGPDGATRWRVEPIPGGEFSQSLAAVAVGNGVVVGVFDRDAGGIVAWDRASGRELWRLVSNTSESAETLPLTIAINATPLISGDLVFLTNGLLEVFALELATGKVRWRVWLDQKGFDWGNATVGGLAIANGVLLVPSLYRDLYGLDAATGAIRWRVAAAPGPLRTTHYRGSGMAGFEAGPVITGDTVWAADTSGQLGAYALASGEARWRTELGVPVLAGLAVAGDALVVASYDGTVRLLAPGRTPPAAVARSCTVKRSSGCCQSSPLSAGWPMLLVVFGLARRRIV